MLVSVGDMILALKDIWQNEYVKAKYIGKHKDQPNYCYIQLDNGNYVLIHKEYLFLLRGAE